MENSLTSLHPYLRYAVNDRLDVWGVLGYGWGNLTLKPVTGGTLETDTNLMMGSFGGRGILRPALENGGFELATRTDAMFTRLSSEAVAGLAAVDADAHRLRVVLEGSRPVTWPEGQSVTPSMEVGVRHDWGDAETGFGLELGGRVQYADPGHGLTIEAAVRGLLAHEDSDYEEWGASGTIRIDPGPMGQGLALTLSPAWGAAASGVDGLWSRQTTAGLAPQGGTQAQAGRLNAQVGYGLWLPSTGGLVTPFTGVSVTDGDGWRTRAGLVFDRPGTWGGGLRVELAGESNAPPPWANRNRPSGCNCNSHSAAAVAPRRVTTAVAAPRVTTAVAPRLGRCRSRHRPPLTESSPGHEHPRPPAPIRAGTGLLGGIMPRLSRRHGCRRRHPSRPSTGPEVGSMSCNSGRSRITPTRSRQGRNWPSTCWTSSAMTAGLPSSGRRATVSPVSCSRRPFPPPKPPPPCVRGFKRAAWPAPSRRLGLRPAGTRTGGVSPKLTAVAEAVAPILRSYSPPVIPNEVGNLLFVFEIMIGTRVKLTKYSRALQDNENKSHIISCK